MQTLPESTDALRDTFTRCLADFTALTGRPRRALAKQIRELAVQFPWLGDLIPDDVWEAVYRVRAVGTVAPHLEPSA